MKRLQPTGITDYNDSELYERGTGKKVDISAIGFRGIRTTSGKAIDWKDLFYNKVDAVSEKYQTTFKNG